MSICLKKIIYNYNEKTAQKMSDLSSFNNGSKRNPKSLFFSKQKKPKRKQNTKCYPQD